MYSRYVIAKERLTSVRICNCQGAPYSITIQICSCKGAPYYVLCRYVIAKKHLTIKHVQYVGQGAPYYSADMQLPRNTLLLGSYVIAKEHLTTYYVDM